MKSHSCKGEGETYHRICSKEACAQYSPRLACPLLVSLFMQLHDGPQTAPALGLHVVFKSIIHMQIHAPYACMLKNERPAREKAAESKHRRE